MKARAWLLAMLLAMPAGAIARDAFEIAGVAVAAGQRTDFEVPVPAGETDPSTVIPVTVLHGAAAGPTLLVTAGVHGYEFAPILAAAALAEELKPASMRGTLVIVRVANLPAFEQRVPYVNPFDRRNLNRAFPGNLAGTQTERIASVLSSQLIARADFVIDVHSGDGAEWLEPFVGVYGGVLAARYDEALSVARATGFRNIVRYRMDSREQVDRSRSLNRQAVAQGVPTVLIEAGENGRRDPAQVEAILGALRGALGALGLAEAGVPVAGQAFRYFDGTESAVSRTTGLWSPAQSIGRFVRKGEVLGVVHDHRGRLVETIVAPVDGRALYGLAGPPVQAGESAVTIALPVDALD